MLQTSYLCYSIYPLVLVCSLTPCSHCLCDALSDACMLPVMVGAVSCGERHLCYDVRVGLTRSRQPMTIGDTSHVMCQANDGEGRSVGPQARTLGCSWLETSRRDAPLYRAR